MQLTPDSVSAIDARASLLAAAPNPRVRNPSEAIRLAERAASLTARRDPNALDILAVAYASDAQFERAVTTAHEALALKPAAALAAMIQQHLALFKESRPYVSSR